MCTVDLRKPDVQNPEFSEFSFQTQITNEPRHKLYGNGLVSEIQRLENWTFVGRPKSELIQISDTYRMCIFSLAPST